jgi:predicted Zn-dependent protease with MMP-like domain
MPLRRIVLAAAVALSAGLTLIVLLRGGFSADPATRAAETMAVILVVAALVFGAAINVALRFADWREPEGEEAFDEVVERVERLAREGTAADPEEMDFLELDPFDDEDFAELVSDALDDLPELLRGLLERGNVAVVISDHGRRHHAYGLYRGDGAHRDDVPDQVLIFRDTLRRDFGRDPERLREEVVKTVRHELAHHVGFDELGVRDLGL